MTIVPIEVAVLLALLDNPGSTKEIINRISLWTDGELVITYNNVLRLISGHSNGDGCDYHGGMIKGGLLEESKVGRVKVFRLSETGMVLAEKYLRSLRNLVGNCR